MCRPNPWIRKSHKEAYKVAWHLLRTGVQNGALWGALGVALLGLGACEDHAAQKMRTEAEHLLSQGRAAQAAEKFLATAHLAKGSALGEEALYWASLITHYFLKNNAQAEKLHRRLITENPQGTYAREARVHLAALYEKKPNSLHRALQLWRKVLQQTTDAAEIERLKRNMANIHVRMRHWDEARYMYRDILRSASSPQVTAETEYLVAHSYFLQGRTKIALAIMQKIAKNHTHLAVGAHASFFVADTLEEQGRIREAIQTFRQAKAQHPRKDMVEYRIRRLQLRLKRSVR